MKGYSVGKMKTLDEVIKAWSICFSDNSRSNCTGCPYADEDGEAACFNHDREDALHYLKEYRENKSGLEKTKEALEVKKKIYEDMTEKIMQQGQENEARCQAEITRYQEAVIELKHKEKEVNDILTDYVALKQWWAEQQENPPLTWDELRTMGGKPVWVEGYYPSAWYIVREVQKNKDGTEDIILDGFQGLTGIGRDDKYGDVENGWQAYRKER